MQRRSLSRIAIAALSAAVGALTYTPNFISDGKAPRGWRNPLKILFSANRFTPHQGARECARRRGGADWLAIRNADRASRGLAPLPR
jgi:hypothetical protein